MRRSDPLASFGGDRRSEELLELFDPMMERKTGDSSTGNKRKLAIGLAFPAFLPNERLAQREAVGMLVVACLARGRVIGNYVVVERLTPMHSFDPSTILVGGISDFGGALVLLSITAALVLASRIRFERIDVQ